MECTASNTITSTTCSFDGGPAESCSLPLRLTIGEFGTDVHLLVITFTDEFGQTVSLDLSFSVPPPLLSINCEHSAVPGRAEFTCTTSNDISTVTCSYNGGPLSNCSLDQTLTIAEFGAGQHYVVITVTDVYGQTLVSNQTFVLIEPLEPPTGPGEHTLVSDEIKSACIRLAGPSYVCALCDMYVHVYQTVSYIPGFHLSVVVWRMSHVMQC